MINILDAMIQVLAVAGTTILPPSGSAAAATSEGWQWAELVKAVLPLLQPLFGVIIGGIIVILTQDRAERRKDKRNLNTWFQEEYVVNGIDMVMVRLRGLAFSYRFLLKHFDSNEVKPKEKVSNVLKEPISSQFGHAIGKLQMILPKDFHYDLAIAALDDKLCDKLEKREVERRLPFASNFTEHLARLRKIFASVEFDKRQEILSLSKKKEIELFVEQEKNFYRELVAFIDGKLASDVEPSFGSRNNTRITA